MAPEMPELTERSHPILIDPKLSLCSSVILGKSLTLPMPEVVFMAFKEICNTVTVAVVTVKVHRIT